jgi:hypothetical protein
MEFYPQNVMLLCVYFACKVDEYTIGKKIVSIYNCLVVLNFPVTEIKKWAWDTK